MNLDPLTESSPGGPQLWLSELCPNSILWMDMNLRIPWGLVSWLNTHPGQSAHPDSLPGPEDPKSICSDSICTSSFPCSALYPSGGHLPAMFSRLSWLRTSGFWLGSSKRLKSRREGDQGCSPPICTPCSITSSSCATSTVSRTWWKNWNSGSSPWLPRNLLFGHVNAQYICTFSVSSKDSSRIQHQKKPVEKYDIPSPWEHTDEGVAIVMPPPAAVQPSRHARTLRPPTLPRTLAMTTQGISRGNKSLRTRHTHVLLTSAQQFFCTGEFDDDFASP